MQKPAEQSAVLSSESQGQPEASQNHTELAVTGQEQSEQKQSDEQKQAEAAAQQSARAAQQLRSEGRQLRAVTYFGEEWPVNFWSSDFQNMEADFRQIRADGFNSIIICVPWNEFQPKLAGRESAVSEEMLGRLRLVMQRAKDADLMVLLRLGYTWDYYGNADIQKRYAGLVTSASVRDAFYAYASRIYQEVSGFDNFAGGFLTWEDFWNYVEGEKHLAGTLIGANEAKASGYTDYVRAHYTDEELIQLYGSPQAAQAAAFPSPGSPAYRLFLEWYDSVLMKLLRETQTVFPNLSFECRLDTDPYNDGAGTQHYAHDKIFGCEGASYTSAMLSASMGYGEGSLLTAEEATAAAKNQLNRLMVTGKPVFVDQFLYMESTPGYETAAKLADDAQVNSYLQTMGTVFRDLTGGYGIWTYRDYRDNQLYNPGFALGLGGWTVEGSVSTVQTETGLSAELKKGAVLGQSLKGRSFLSKTGMKLSLHLTSETPAKLQITTDAGSQTVDIEAGERTVELQWEKQASDQLKLTLLFGEQVLIDDVRLYSHITEGRIYDVNRQAGPYLEGIRALNQNMMAVD